MKYILKFIIGFSFVMTILLLVVIVINYGWYVFYAIAFILSILLCYKIGNDIWNDVKEVYDDWETK